MPPTLAVANLRYDLCVRSNCASGGAWRGIPLRPRWSSYSVHSAMSAHCLEVDFPPKSQRLTRARNRIHAKASYTATYSDPSPRRTISTIELRSVDLLTRSATIWHGINRRRIQDQPRYVAEKARPLAVAQPADIRQG
jgi:hypothetical protein